MDPIQFIFTLLSKHVGIKGEQLVILEKEGRDWYYGTETNKIKDFIKQYSEQWWCKTLLAVLFIFASRWLFDFMNPVRDDDFDDDDD